MPSFLTTDRMNAALAERVEQSLKGRAGRTRLAPGALALLRVVAVASILGCVLWIISEQETRESDLETARADLLQRLQTASAAVATDGDDLILRLEAWLVESAGVYEGDVISEELRTAGALRTLLKRPGLYVRGPITTLGDHAAIASEATRSAKDALLACLLDPPESKDEAELLKSVHTAYRGEDAMDSATHVERLFAAVVGLPVLSAEWQERVHRAKDVDSVRRLAELFRLAPIEEAQRGAKAELFIFALDEPKTDNSPSEFDGATRHLVRVHVVDLKESRILVRVRRLVDPAWISEAKRHRYASGLTGCRLAIEVHEATSPAETAPEAAPE